MAYVPIFLQMEEISNLFLLSMIHQTFFSLYNFPENEIPKTKTLEATTNVHFESQFNILPLRRGEIHHGQFKTLTAVFDKYTNTKL